MDHYGHPSQVSTGIPAGAEGDGHGGAGADAAAGGESAAVEFDDFPADREAEAGAFAGGFGGVEGIEDAVEVGLGDAVTGVFDADKDDRVGGAEAVGGTAAGVGGFAAGGEAAARPQAERAAAVTHGMERVDDEVEEDLLEPLYIEGDFGQVFGEIFDDGDAGAHGVVADEGEDLAHAFVDVDGLDIELAVGGEIDHAADDAVGAVDGARHFVEDFAVVGVDVGGQLAEVFEAHEDHGERVFHLVGDAGGEAADGFHFFGLDEQLLHGAQFVVGGFEGGVEFEQVFFGAFARGDVGGHAGDADGLAGGVVNGHFHGQPVLFFAADVGFLLEVEGAVLAQHGFVVVAVVAGGGFGENVEGGASDDFVLGQADEFLVEMVDHDVAVFQIADEEQPGGFVEDLAEQVVGFEQAFAGAGVADDFADFDESRAMGQADEDG